MGAIDEFLEKYDPDTQPVAQPDPDDAALAALEEQFLDATKEVITPVLTQEDREQWRGRRSPQLGGLLGECAAGLQRVPALAQHVGLSSDEVTHVVESDAAACGYIKVLEAVYDGADCGALRLAETCHALIRETLVAVTSALPALPPTTRQAVSAGFAPFQIGYEAALAKGEVVQARNERVVQPLTSHIDRLAVKQEVAQVVRQFLEDVKQRGSAAVTTLVSAAAKDNGQSKARPGARKGAGKGGTP